MGSAKSSGSNSILSPTAPNSFARLADVGALKDFHIDPNLLKKYPSLFQEPDTHGSIGTAPFVDTLPTSRIVPNTGSLRRPRYRDLLGSAKISDSNNTFSTSAQSSRTQLPKTSVPSELFPKSQLTAGRAPSVKLKPNAKQFDSRVLERADPSPLTQELQKFKGKGLMSPQEYQVSSQVRSALLSRPSQKAQSPGSRISARIPLTAGISLPCCSPRSRIGPLQSQIPPARVRP